MTIGILTNGIFPLKVGGIQKHSLYLSYHLARLGQEIHLFIISSEQLNKEALFDSLKNEDDEQHKKAVNRILLHYIPPVKLLYFPGHFILSAYLNSKKIYDYFTNQRIPLDFVYAQGFTGWYLAKKDNLLVGINPHGLEMYQIQVGSQAAQLMIAWAMRQNLKKTDKVFSLGKGLDKIIASLGIRKNDILRSPNGIEASWVPTAFEKEGPAKNRRALFIGRYERRKGVEELTSVIMHNCTLKNLELCFIGPIPERLKIKQKQVKYLGLIKDSETIKLELSKSDILICPSYSEGMPTVILEAMSQGLAIIATDVGAVSELVDNTNGWLIPPKNKEALNGALEKALSISNEELRLKQRQSWEKVKRYTWSEVAKQTLSEIQRAIDLEA
jgi:glycosyltransferase involved in cell wall biosynthesis